MMLLILVYYAISLGVQVAGWTWLQTLIRVLPNPF